MRGSRVGSEGTDGYREMHRFSQRRVRGSLMGLGTIRAAVGRTLPVLFSLSALVAMAWYALSREEMLEAISGVRPGYVLSLLVLATLGVVAQGEQFRAALRVSKIEIRPSEATGLTAINTMANYYVPAKGGTVLRAAYMRTVHAMGLDAYVVLTLITVLTGLVVAVVVGICATALLYVTGSGVGAATLSSTVGVFASGALIVVGVCLLLLVLTPRATIDLLERVLPRFVGSALRRFGTTVTLWRDVPTAMYRLLLWTVAVFALSTLRLYVAFVAVGADVGVLEMILVGAYVSMSFVISLTPGNLGIREGVTAFAGALVGVGSYVALLGSLVDRGAALVVTFVIGGLSYRPLKSRFDSR